MRNLGELLLPVSQAPSISVPQNPNSTFHGGAFNWLFQCHGFFHNATLILASLGFVLYLTFQAKKSFTKLSNGRSHIMVAYYGSLWLVSFLNLCWSLLQIELGEPALSLLFGIHLLHKCLVEAPVTVSSVPPLYPLPQLALECTPGKEQTWNVLSLFTTSGMLFLEVSLIAFLLQGNYASGLDALTRTFAISALVVGLDILLKALYLFGLGIPLFIDIGEQSNGMKWGLWVIHRLVLTAIYGSILFMYHSKWRERLPARPAFYRYIVIMFVLNALALFACGLSGNGSGFGYWLYITTIVSYHALYLPLIYITFLADFFQEEDLHLENVYYSEMKDAGFFDADWE